MTRWYKIQSRTEPEDTGDRGRIESMDTDKVQRLAKELAEAFVVLDRANTDGAPRLVTLRDGSPDWMTDVCHDAHGSMMPDDWRYWMIEYAADALGEGTDPEDGSDFADAAVPIYNADRIAWLASHLERAGYVDEAVSEYGTGTDGGILAQIGLGIYAELTEVFGLVAQALDDVDEDEDGDDEDEDGGER